MASLVRITVLLLFLASATTAQTRLSQQSGTTRGLPRSGVVVSEEDWQGTLLRFYTLQPVTRSTPLLHAKVGADNLFEVRGLATGHYRVSARPNDASRSFEVSPVEVAAGPIRIVVPKGSISGAVVGVRSSGPIWVHAVRLSSDLRESLGLLARTDGSGRFTLERVPAGSWQLKASQGQSSTAPELVKLDDEESLGGLLLNLEEAAPVKGRILDSAGAPVPRLRGFVNPSDPDEDPLGFPRELTVEEGRFEIATGVLDPRRSTVLFAAPGYPVGARLVGTEERTLTMPDTGAALELRLKSARVSELYLVNSQGAPFGVTQVMQLLDISLQDRADYRRLTIPNLETGAYEVFRVVDLEDLIAVHSGRQSSEDAVGSVVVSKVELGVLMID
jgi:hypothetical protein